jgi:hypothetical protein
MPHHPPFNNIRAALSKLTSNFKFNFKFFFMSDTPPKNFLLPESSERYTVHTLDSFLLAEDNRTLCESIAVRRIAYHKAQQHPFHERVILELTPHDSESKRQDFPPCAYAERSRTTGDGSSCGSLFTTPESSSVSVGSLSPDLAVPAKDVLHIPDRKNRVSFDKEVEPLKDTTALIRIVTLRTPPSLAQVVLMMQALHNQRPLYTIVDLTEVKKGGQCYWFAKMLCVALESKYDGQESAAAHKKLGGTYRSVSLVKSVKLAEVTAVLLKFDKAEEQYHVRQRKSVVSLCQ